MDHPASVPPGFDVLAELGRGTTGVVYRVRHSILDRVVALKTPTLTADGRIEQLARFLREAQALASMSDEFKSRIPPIHQVGEFQGHPFYVRELVEGSALEQQAEAGAISLREAVAVLAAVAETIHKVHGRGFAHRNLHPANILVSSDGAARLIGFGRVGLLAGSEMLPPGAAGVPVAVDLQGLGRMLPWLCWKLRQPIPAPLAAIAHRCSTAGNAQGYDSASALADDLARCRGEGPA